jgi:hypothetical protein
MGAKKRTNSVAPYTPEDLTTGKGRYHTLKQRGKETVLWERAKVAGVPSTRNGLLRARPFMIASCYS